MENEFIEIYNKYIKRDGADKFLEYLKNTDFLKAPASTRFHLCVEGGLAQHSINVYKRLKDLCKAEADKGSECFKNISDETIAICGLLHDVCKANFYDVEMRNKKNENGVWEKIPVYVVNDKLPYGHGEKSVYIISSFIHLSRDEAFAIRWHMGYSDTDFKGGGYSVGNAFSMFPLAVMTHIADLMASSLDEIA